MHRKLHYLDKEAAGAIQVDRAVNDRWLVEYLSISAIVKRSRSDYVSAFLHTESDESDLSYFIEHQLDVLQRAVDGLRGYLGRKAAERRQIETFLRPDSRLGTQLNHRQRALLLNALGESAPAFEISRHRAKHGVAYATARANLLKLVELGLMKKHLSGKRFVFTPVAGLARRLGTRRQGGTASDRLE